jgi:phosphotransferase system enzyme I (PtsP)
MNAGLLVDLPHLAESGAEGIGLFRTELQFMIAATDAQAQGAAGALYGNVIETCGGRKPVTFRTLDIGGDKVLPYMRDRGRGESGDSGWRAIRLGARSSGPAPHADSAPSSRPRLASELRVMLPMVTDLDEIRRTRVLIERDLAHLRRHGHTEPERLLIGAMVEVPALLFDLDGLMKEADFISVGSNDLLQFMTATDRGNTRVAGRFDPLSRPFLRALRQIVRTAGAAQLPVTLCGEMAGNPIAAMALIGLGYRALSMSAAALGPVKAMLLALDIDKLSSMLHAALDDKKSQTSVREMLVVFAAENGVPL